mgnify:CR=1 FL=1
MNELTLYFRLSVYVNLQIVGELLRLFEDKLIPTQ